MSESEPDPYNDFIVIRNRLYKIDLFRNPI